ncbi:MAG: hypothetical protein ABIA21_02850 [Candidatus Aenigmatarchaeota archaeon]
MQKEHLLTLCESEYNKKWIDLILTTARELKIYEHDKKMPSRIRYENLLGDDRDPKFLGTRVCWVSTIPSNKTKDGFRYTGRLGAHCTDRTLPRDLNEYAFEREITGLLYSARPNMNSCQN